MDRKIQLNENTFGIRYNNWDDRRLTKTRVYTSVSEQEVKDQYGLDRPEFSQKGEDLENDKAWKKYNRAEVAIMKAKVLVAFEDLGMESITVKFSRTAGCSCGCSAGFVADHLIMTPDATGYFSSIYVGD